MNIIFYLNLRILNILKYNNYKKAQTFQFAKNSHIEKIPFCKNPILQNPFRKIKYLKNDWNDIEYKIKYCIRNIKKYLHYWNFQMCIFLNGNSAN